MARYYGLTPQQCADLTWDQYNMLVVNKEKVMKNLGEIEKSSGRTMNKTAAPMRG